MSEMSEYKNIGIFVEDVEDAIPPAYYHWAGKSTKITPYYYSQDFIKQYHSEERKYSLFSKPSVEAPSRCCAVFYSTRNVISDNATKEKGIAYRWEDSGWHSWFDSTHKEAERQIFATPDGNNGRFKPIIISYNDLLPMSYTDLQLALKRTTNGTFILGLSYQQKGRTEYNEGNEVFWVPTKGKDVNLYHNVLATWEINHGVFYDNNGGSKGNEAYVFIGTRDEVEEHKESIGDQYIVDYFTDYAVDGVSDIFPIGENIDESKTVYSYPVRLRNELLDFNVDIKHRGMVKDFIVTIPKDNNKIKNDPSSILTENNNRLFLTGDFTTEKGATWASDIASYETGLRRSIEIDNEGNKTFGNPYDYCDVRKIPMQAFKDLSYVDFSIYLEDGSLYYEKQFNEVELAELNEIVVSDIFFEFNKKCYYVLKAQTKTGAKYNSGEVSIREPQHLDFSINGGFEVDTGSTKIYDRGIRSVYSLGSQPEILLSSGGQTSVSWIVNDIKLANPAINKKDCYFKLEIKGVSENQAPSDNNIVWNNSELLGVGLIPYKEMGKPHSINLAYINEETKYISFTVKCFKSETDNAVPEIINGISYSVSPLVYNTDNVDEYSFVLSSENFPYKYTLQSIENIYDDSNITRLVVGGTYPDPNDDKKTISRLNLCKGRGNRFEVLAYLDIQNYHCNDITWNPNTNKLYIADMGSFGTINVCEIDIESNTIQQLDDIVIEEAVKDNVKFSAISYDIENDRYYVGQPINRMYTLDSEFKFINSVKTTDECKEVISPGNTNWTSNTGTATQGSFCKDSKFYVCSSVVSLDFDYDIDGKVKYNNKNSPIKREQYIRRITNYNLRTGNPNEHHDYFAYGKYDEIEAGYVTKSGSAYIASFTTDKTSNNNEYIYKAHVTQLIDGNNIIIVNIDDVETSTIKDTIGHYQTNHMTNVSEVHPVNFTDNNNSYTFEFGNDGTSEYNSQYIDFVADIYPSGSNSFDILSPTNVKVTIEDAKCQDDTFPELQFYMIGVWDGARGVSDRSKGFVKNENNMYSDVINPATWDENVLVNGEANSNHFKNDFRTITYSITNAQKNERLSHSEQSGNIIVFDGNKFIFRFKTVFDNNNRGVHGDIKYLKVNIEFTDGTSSTPMQMIRAPYDVVCRCFEEDYIKFLTQDYNYSFEIDGETYYLIPSHTSVWNSPILLSPTGYGMKYVNNSGHVVWEYGSVTTKEPVGVHIDTLPTYTCPWELITYTHGGSVDFIDKFVNLTDNTTLFKYGDNVNLIIGDEYDVGADEWSDCLADSIYDLIIDNQMEQGRKYNWVTENLSTNNLLEPRAIDFTGNLNSVQYMLRRYLQFADRSYSDLGLTVGVGNMNDEDTKIADNLTLSNNDYRYCVYTANVFKPQIWRPSYSVIPEFTSKGGFTSADSIVLVPSSVGCIRHKDVHIEFDSVTIEDFKGNQFVSIISPNTTVQKNKQFSTINTIGGKMPYIVSNSENDYYTGTTSGVFAIYDCENCDFDFKRSRLYRDTLNDVLTSVEPKILRTLDGYGFIIGVCNPSEQYNGHRYLVITSFDWTQIGDLNNMADISEFGIKNNPLFIKGYQYRLN